ncbi:MAG TPA: tetratricopeptide repeat protein, partial [Pirellulales bacterium]|nr:tetratricopeptide repeat protein [Pirellulales bacterium]
MARVLCPHWAGLSLAIALVLQTTLRADDANDRYTVAAAHYAAQRWDLAVEEFRALVKEHPDDTQSVKSQFFLGEALVQLGKYDEARTEFQRFLARDPVSPYAAQALFRSGESAFLAGDRAAARQTLEEFRKRHPDDKLNSFALMYLGQLAAADKQWAESAKMFSELLDSKPERPLADKARYQLAEAQYHSGDFAAAIATLEAGANTRGAADGSSGRDEIARRYLLALAYQGAKRDTDALAILDELAATASGDQAEKIKLARASSLISLERFAAAAESLESYLSSQPHGDFAARALGELAACQLHLGQSEKAVTTLDRLLAISPDGPAAAEAAWNRGQILEKLNRFDPAIASYQVILEKHASSDRFEEALLATARLQSQLHQYEAAIEIYGRFLRERSHSPQLDAAHYGLAWALRDAGKRPKSDEQFQKLHDEFPRSQFWNDATFRLADDAFAAKQSDRAAKLVDELLAAKPPADLMAHALYLKGESETAAERWDRVAEVM